MDPGALRALLQQVAQGSTSVEDAAQALRELPFQDLGFANVDHHRALRVGVPEVVFAAGKAYSHLEAITEAIAAKGQNALITRLEQHVAERLLQRFPTLQHNALARTGLLATQPIEICGRGPIAIVTAGTSDIPVAEEAAITAAALGNEVTRLFDVGVAGLHRLLSRRAVLDAASVIIVVAGMEGALASVVGGLVSKPVIAVPTSIGYGSNFGGLAALLTMLNSCSSGITVVNIDNGFGAAYAATLINRAA